MPHIQQLSPHIADLIAAGEVVERPASVVKELLENAIDAGATAVTVEIKDGGMTYLRVSDDGCGIAPDELPTAFLRHATSKLRTAEDLAAIGTLGFRGEALAAIASVSRLDIFSRTQDAPAGAMLHLEGGVPGTVREAGCPEGTSVIVRDLFFNTPARFKFMKRDSAEASAISGLVAHLALSHPSISFKLIKDGTEALHTPGDGALKSAIYAALGREFALSLIEVRASDGSLAANGFVTKPLNGRGTRGMQTFFVNGRLVKSQLLTAALEEAYSNRIMKGKYPGCVLSVTLPCDMVDVNVHPAKTIVKFLNEKLIFDLVYHGVTDALDRDGAPEPVKPGVPQARQVQNPRGDFYQSMTAEQFRAQGAPKSKGSAPVFQTRIPAVNSELSGRLTAADVMRRAQSAPSKPSAPAVTAYEAPAKPVNIPTPAPGPAPVSAPEPEQVSLMQEDIVPWRIAGEVLDTYIVCEDAEKNVWLIDKHAAHERVNFDRFKARTEPIMSQTLLTPLAADFPSAEFAALTAQLPLLQEFGFDCEEFGPNSLLLRAIPADIGEGEAVSALEEIAGDLITHAANPADARDALLATLACKAAIKGGMKSDARELRVLVDKVQSGEIEYCPHGRPVKAKLSKYELEKMFKRVT